MSFTQVELDRTLGPVLTDFRRVTSEEQQTAINLLAQEFYGHSDVSKGMTKFSHSLKEGGERGVIAMVGHEVAGIATYKEYAIAQIAEQLYVEAQYKDGQLALMRLRPFSQLTRDYGFLGNYIKAVEFAYITVDPEFRSKKIGSTLFRHQTDEITKGEGDCLIFTLARGIYAQSDIETKVTKYMLDIEKQNNGLRENGKVRVTGVWIDSEEASRNIGFDLTVLNPYSGSGQTVHLIEKSGGKPIGFSRNLSPAWCVEKNSIRVWK